MIFPVSKISLQRLSDELFDQKQVCLSVLRLDTLHRVVSGNKLYKLHYFLQNALQQSLNGMVTFGGAYSNHLVAMAFACKEAGLKSIGIVRGERPPLLSHTLHACIDYGMTLKFISRQEYSEKEQPGFLKEIKAEYENYLVVPEGGYDPAGSAGAAMIIDLINEDCSHICCAVGTATTLAGLLQGIKKEQQIIGIPVLKNMHDIPQRIKFLTNHLFNPQQLKIINDYHFGGYAKKTPALVDWMNLLYQKHQLPTDFVYTGKMMFGIIDRIKKDLFQKGSKIVCIHTGGLQGNLSLPPGTLVF
ncbi:MAG: pyridoxal-phosphate dependent enzyme [Ferruginibacter sp.]|nr:pyridoxal-phosphate dependent enzyme [Ferruginibacter sp.]